MTHTTEQRRIVAQVDRRTHGRARRPRSRAHHRSGSRELAARALFRLHDALDDIDDVQQVFANAGIDATVSNAAQA